jgi:hypothetical protein
MRLGAGGVDAITDKLLIQAAEERLWEALSQRLPRRLLGPGCGPGRAGPAIRKASAEIGTFPIWRPTCKKVEAVDFTPTPRRSICRPLTD